MLKTVRKHGRITLLKCSKGSCGSIKQSEGLAPRTIEEYQIHLQWFLNYLGQDLSKEEITLETFLEKGRGNPIKKEDSRAFKTS